MFNYACRQFGFSSLEAYGNQYVLVTNLFLPSHGPHFNCCHFRLFGFNGGKLRMDERINLSMSDPDLLPLLVEVMLFLACLPAYGCNY